MNLIKRYEQYLEERVRSGELKGVTKENYTNAMSYVLEALVGQMPVEVVQSYCEVWGAGGDYKPVIRKLAELAKNGKGDKE